MANWKKPLKRVGRHVRNPLRKLKMELKQELGWLERPLLLPYRTFGTTNGGFRLLGRVLEDSGLSQTARHNGAGKNALAMVKRFASDNLPGVCVRAQLADQTHTARTDEAGYFEFVFDALPTPVHGDWHNVELTLLDQVVAGQGTVSARGEVLVPPASARFGVISDVDDTIVVSHATQSLRKIKLMMLRNARTRAPFEGVAAFYRALYAGGSGQERNPIFYVSSSEWNLYDLLVEFCHYRSLPKGPFLLRELDADWYKVWRSGGGSHGHKHAKIRRVLTTYPDLPFVLIGDSGQHDAEIYAQTVRDYPGRILAVYIRDVARKHRDRQVVKLADQLRPLGVDMLLVKNTAAAARHAAAHGWIAPQQVATVDADRRADNRAPTEAEQMLGGS